MKQNSWLYSDSFIKRALAIYGYGIVGNLLVTLPFVVVIFIIAITIGAGIQTAP
jgi:hypothetical protein